MAARSEFIIPAEVPGQPSLDQPQRIRTVVVDDSETFLEVTCGLLDLEDVIQLVAAASDGVDAIDTVMRLKPALVLMDVNMPGVDGLTAASLLTEMSSAPAVVLMSAEDSPRLRAAAVRAGAFAFVHKPNFREEFENVPTAFCGARRCMREILALSLRPTLNKTSALLKFLRNNKTEKQRMKRTTITAVVALLAFTGMLAYAQKRQPPDPARMVQHRVDFLTQKLGLSSAQQQQATTIFTNALTNAKSMHDQMRTAHQNLQAATEKNDIAGIDQAANAIGNLTAQTIAAHAKTEATFYQTLNPDQQAKYNEISSHGPGRLGFGGRGFGGHGGPLPF